METLFGTDTSPSSAFSSPVMRRKIVVLPAPFGPTRPIFSPSFSWKDASTKRTCRPYCLLMPESAIMGRGGSQISAWPSLDHRDAPRVAAAARRRVERGLQKDAHDGEGRLLGDHPLAQGEDVRVVVLARRAGGRLAPAERAAHALHLVRDDRLAVSRAAEDDAAVARAARDGLGRGPDEEGVVDHVRRERPEVLHVVPHPEEEGLDPFLVREAGVVGAEGDFHGRRVYPRPIQWRIP